MAIRCASRMSQNPMAIRCASRMSYCSCPHSLPWLGGRAVSAGDGLGRAILRALTHQRAAAPVKVSRASNAVRMLPVGVQNETADDDATLALADEPADRGCHGI